MKIIARTFTLFIVAILLPLSLLGQAKSITSESYHSTLREAESKTDKQIRKVGMVQKLYINGDVSGTLTTTSEYLPPDKSKWSYVEDRGYSVKRMEGIRVGSFEYRKVDNGEWTKREWESGENYGLSGTDDSTREYFIEDATIGKEKFKILIEKRIYADKTYVDEKKVWINKNGLIIKKTTTTEAIELKNIVSSAEFTYDFNVKPPKIEAPIK